MPTADLEIALFRAETTIYKEAKLHTVDLRFGDPYSNALPTPVRGTARFDLPKLASLEWNEPAYGLELTNSLFGDTAVSEGFDEFRTVAFSRSPDDSLRLRLYVAPGAPELATLRWETLRDPKDKTRRLLTHQNIFFSRFMSGSDWRPVQLRPKRSLRALVVIASPSDLGPQPGSEGGWSDLAPLDVEAERLFAETNLREFHPTVLGRGEATLSKIFNELRSEFDVLYLICHGALDSDGNPWIVLEDDMGKALHVPGHDFAARLGDLKHRPRLVVFASCQSGGVGHAVVTPSPAGSGDAAEALTSPPGEVKATSDGEGALPALGPRLMRVGIPAVLAMQGRVLMSTVAKFMPVFFDELRKDGLIDSAMTVARGAVRDQPDGWAPVLFMRLLSGRIWYVPGFSTLEEDEEYWPALLTRIKNQTCTPIIGSGLLEPLVRSTREIARHWAEAHHFPMFPSDQEDLPQVAQYLSVIHEDYYLRKTFVTELLERLGHPEAAGAEDDEPSERRLRKALSAAGRKLREANEDEPHRVLASLRCPLYITTNPDDLLADALRAVEKTPQVELCRWRPGLAWPPSVFNGEGEAAEDEEEGYRPTVGRPLVYHLFGHLRLLNSLVLTEDNYFDYLIGVSRRGKEDPIPSYVSSQLVQTALLFVGFKIDDWDFRVFFRSLRNRQSRLLSERIKHVAVQIDPEADRFLDPARARRYLQKYFVGADIYVYWGSTEDFLTDLRVRWEAFLLQEGQP